MSWEYHYLKHRLGITEDYMLQLFERYCEDSYDTVHKMEWSCKVRENSCLLSRFLHSSQIKKLSKARTNLDRLLNELSFKPESLSVAPGLWRKLVDEMVERIHVAYAGSDHSSGGNSVIKVYLGIRDYTFDIHTHILKSCLPELPDVPPPGIPGVMFGFSIDGNGHSLPRVYIYYDSAEYDAPEVKAYIADLVGKRGLYLLRSYPRSAVSLKSGGTDMLYVSMRQPHSQMRTLVADVAETLPVLAERINRLTWVGVPLVDEFTEFPKELNIYVELIQ